MRERGSAATVVPVGVTARAVDIARSSVTADCRRDRRRRPITAESVRKAD